MEKEMNDLKIGDRVRTISVPTASKLDKSRITIGMKGTVKDLSRTNVGIEFDHYMGGHDGLWKGKDGHCWYVETECLEKIEETKEEAEEMKEETVKQKILEVLRKEIGVAVGEKFDIYQKGVKQWTCKFEGAKFFHKVNYEFCESEVWIDIICNFHKYTFKIRPFIPKHGEVYFSLVGERDENKDIKVRVVQSVWTGDFGEYVMEALGNVFRSEKEAFKNKDKILEKLERLRKGEV